ncbi:MAG: hypothetical protein O7G85_13465 [Planctomycetota bacterium]|nr:hypothetical protein [Planctomycetota bacterium]
MPELPEVEFGRKLAESVAKGRVIEKVTCAKDDLVFPDASPRKMTSALKGKRVLEVRRRGKQLWFVLDAPPHPLFHFGMTGAFLTPGPAPGFKKSLQLASSPKDTKDEDWPPRFVKIHLYFDGGGELVMTNKRRLGRILLRDDPENEKPISKLGFDPLLDLPSPKIFCEKLLKRKIPIKALLLDQGFSAGVGNWIADEILYQAKIAPSRVANTLSEIEARRVRTKMKSIIDKAVSVDADKTRFPKTWLFHYRWGKNANAKTSKGEKIIHEQHGGRTTAWVPGVQV